MSEVLTALRVPFPASQVKKNQDGLDYVSIDGYINRLLEVIGMGYDFVISQSTVELLPEDMKTRSGKRQYLATVTGELRISYDENFPPTRRFGTGADVSFDPDKAVKTAQAEALKKAAHQYGIALELWDEGHRKDLERARRAAGGSEQALKAEVFAIAKERLGKDKPTAAEVAKVFGRKAGDLADVGVLREILTAEGII